MKWMKEVAIAALAALATCAVSAASLYDEIDGDLPDTLDAAPFLLSAGDNTITGAFYHGSAGYDFDSFSVAVPVGLQLTTLTVTHSDDQLTETVQGTWYYSASLDFGNFSGPSETIGGAAPGDINAMPSPSPDTWFESVFPLGAGTYYFLHGGLGSNFPGGTVPYTMTFTTAQVPLPAAAWLLMSGVGGLGAIARRRQRVITKA
jgi:hypothetical protein